MSKGHVGTTLGDVYTVPQLSMSSGWLRPTLAFRLTDRSVEPSSSVQQFEIIFLLDDDRQTNKQQHLDL